MRDVTEIKELLPLIIEVVEAGGTFRLYPNGNSMRPMIIPGRDSINLVAVDDIKVGDVLFYRSEKHGYAIHRLMSMDSTSLTFCGDNHTFLEYGVRREDLIAKLSGYYSGEEYHDVSEAEYIKYARERVSRIPFYRRNRRLHHFLRKIKNSIKHS